jgi:propionyl-CoA synthetase
MTDYATLYANWRRAPEAYWAGCAKLVDWDVPPSTIFDPDIGPYGVWFPGATLNTSSNCLDRHVHAGNGDRTALIWDSPMTGQLRHISYREALGRVEKFAGALAALGVTKGDRVIIYMPMVPEAAFSMLACARLGAVHSVVFGGFAAPELAARISDAKPKVIIAASCGLEPGRVIAYKPILDAAIALATHQPAACLIFQRPQCEAAITAGRDHDFIAAESAAAPHAPVFVLATDPLYILYTSGTTGRPKGVVRDNGGHAVALTQTINMIFGLNAGEVMWTAADVGWAVGHSYVVYAPFLAGVTSIMYEGKPVGTPDAGAFWRVMAQHRAKTLFTAPTALRAIRQQDPTGKLLGQYDLSAMQALFLAGERCDPPTAMWIQELWISRSLTIGGRRKPAGPSPRAFAAWASRPSNLAPAAAPALVMTSMRWTNPARCCPPAPSATSPSNSPCRLAAGRHCGRMMPATAPPTLPLIPAGTAPVMPGWWMMTAMSGSWAARMT